MAYMLHQIICSTSIMKQIFCDDICLTCEELAAVYCESFIFQFSTIVVNSEYISVSVYWRGKFNSYDQIPNVEPNNLQKTAGLLMDSCY